MKRTPPRYAKTQINYPLVVCHGPTLKATSTCSARIKSPFVPPYSIQSHPYIPSTHPIFSPRLSTYPNPPLTLTPNQIPPSDPTSHLIISSFHRSYYTAYKTYFCKKRDTWGSEAIIVRAGEGDGVDTIPYATGCSISMEGWLEVLGGKRGLLGSGLVTG